MKILKILGRIIAFVVAYIAVSTGVKYWFDSREGDAAIDTLNQIIDEALEQNPNATGIDASEAVRQASADKAGELVASQTTDAQKRAVAIDTFGGFLYVNLITRPEYCRQFGVELTSIKQHPFCKFGYPLIASSSSKVT